MLTSDSRRLERADMLPCWYAMISVMNERQEDKGENHGLDDLANRLREAVSRPLDEWREVYEGFSPVDLESGERRPRMPPPGIDTRRAAVLVPKIGRASCRERV